MATVERWYQRQVKRRVAELSGRSCPRILGIDEHFFNRKQGHTTTLVDLHNHKVFDVVLGRFELSLKQYLNRLPGQEHVQVVRRRGRVKSQQTQRKHRISSCFS